MVPFNILVVIQLRASFARPFGQNSWMRCAGSPSIVTSAAIVGRDNSPWIEPLALTFVPSKSMIMDSRKTFRL